MKTKHISFLLFVAILTFSACREITVRTTVNDDGSFTRTITVKGDSAEAFKKELPYPIDATWAMTAKEDSAGQGKFTVTYTKHFGSSDELQAEISSDTSWRKQLARHISIKKRFGFFYSYIGYREVYSAANPFNAIPFKERLTAEEIQWLTRRHPVQSPADSVKSKAAEDRAMAYLVESAAAVAEMILAGGIRKLNDPRLDVGRVPEFRDSLRNFLANRDFRNEFDLIDAYRTWTGNPAVDRLRELQPPLFREFLAKARFLDHFLMMEGCRVEAGMPGLITGTNSAMLAGNQVAWDLFPMAFLLEDYTMEVESRVLNVWAFVLSGLVILALVSLLIFKSVKK